LKVYGTMREHPTKKRNAMPGLTNCLDLSGNLLTSVIVIVIVVRSLKTLDLRIKFTTA
jgi:hypothetical protein